MTDPLSDAELAEFAEHLAERKRRDPDCLYDDWRVVERLLADAHHHRAALAEAREKNEIMLVNFESVAKHQANRITEAQAEVERLRVEIRAIELNVDALHGLTHKERTHNALAAIKGHCRAALAAKEPK